jgi:hypothetical protein
MRSGTIHDPGHAKLGKTRKVVVAGWLGVAAVLDRQGKAGLAGEVRQFVKSMPPVLTGRERIATELVRIVQAQRAARTRGDDMAREGTLERIR